MKILIAEDDLVTRNFLSKYFSKYGECHVVINGLEILDAFLMALKDGEPYHLICLDIMMPEVDGVKTLKSIRHLERQCGVAWEKRVKIIMTTVLAEVQMVRTDFDYSCEAYASKPIDTRKLIEVLGKLGLIGTSLKETVFFQKEKITTKEGYFKQVQAMPEYQLEVTMETGTTICFDFRSRLNTTRFGKLWDEEMFRSVYTDGNYLIFEKVGSMPVKITASEFMDLVLIDRTR